MKIIVLKKAKSFSFFFRKFFSKYKICLRDWFVEKNDFNFTNLVLVTFISGLVRMSLAQAVADVPTETFLKD